MSEQTVNVQTEDAENLSTEDSNGVPVRPKFYEMLGASIGRNARAYLATTGRERFDEVLSVPHVERGD